MATSYHIRFEVDSLTQETENFRPTSAYLPAATSLQPIPTPLNLYPVAPISLFTKETQAMTQTNPSQTENHPITLTRAEVKEMIDEKINGLKIYVLESDITQAQQAVKSIVELASF